MSHIYKEEKNGHLVYFSVIEPIIGFTLARCLRDGRSIRKEPSQDQDATVETAEMLDKDSE